MIKKIFKKKGLSILEAILVISIMSIMAAGTFFSITAFMRSSQLDTTGDDLIQSLRKAQSNAMMRVKDSQWGVRINEEDSKFTFFKGSCYGEDSSYDIEYTLEGTLWFENVSLNGGGNEIVFEKVTGETDDYGSLDLKAKENYGYRLTINELGRILKEDI